MDTRISIVQWLILGVVIFFCVIVIFSVRGYLDTNKVTQVNCATPSYGSSSFKRLEGDIWATPKGTFVYLQGKDILVDPNITTEDQLRKAINECAKRLQETTR